MNRSELLHWLREEHRQWEALLERVGPARMDQAGVNGIWSFKDLVAHLNPDGVRSVADLQALRLNEPEPPPPWPAHLQNDDEINAYLYEANRERPAHELLEEARQMFQRLFTAMEELPEDVRIDIVLQGEHRYYFVCMNDRRVQPGYIFDHFHDDHEQDVRAWLTRIETSATG